MSWNMSGQIFELCNCDFLCPCWFDPTAEPDRGFCRSAWTFDVQHGESNGVDLSGRNVVLLLGSKGTLADGDLTARLYIDSGASEAQQAELEAIFGGQRGGAWEAMAPMISTVLPTIRTEIDIQWGDQPNIKIGNHATVSNQPVHDPAGAPARITGATVMTMADVGEGQPARPTGSSWSDPYFDEWEPRSSMVMPFTWQV